MANIDDNPPQPAEEPAPEPEEDEEEPADGEDSAEEAADTVADRVRDGLSGMAKWALLTCVFVLVIAVGGIIWLYRSATPDMLPQLTVTFNGVEVEPSAYKWHVPVVGNMFKRTYAKTLNKGTTFATPVDNASPDITLSSRNYDTSLTVTDSDKDVIFEGTVAEFSAYRFNQNGTYTAKLVATAQNVRAAGESSLTGSETWLFTFDIAIRPSVTLSESSITQGGVVAVRVSKTQNGQAPVLQSGLKNAGFVQAVNGWICYVPIPWNAETGTQTLQVVADGYTEPVDLTIRAASWDYKDYTSESQRSTPYIGADDAPAKVKALLTDASQPISWADGGFIQPFLSRLKIKATFGMTEYVGRSYKERSTNYGYGGRTTTNVVVTASKGDSLIAPASGKVLLAQDLSGDAGLTLVIDHGAGVKSIFYNLASVDVKVGAQVKQGQLIATCSKTVVAEMRIGTVPIDPLNVWRGQCNGLKYY